MIKQLPAASKTDVEAGKLPLPPLATVKKLNELATAKLAEIVRKSASGASEWDGYNAAEILAGRALLDQSAQKVAR